MLNLKSRTDLEKLVEEKLPESLTLEYKASPALSRESGGRKELVKDVTAFANSAGGQIIYGIPEKEGVPQPLDGGVDRTQISPEWIDQIISSNASPRIQDLRVTPIPLEDGNGHVAYVLSIPQATTFAPHQNTLDQKYYRRFENRSIPMYDYEIRDILRRATTPELWVDFRFKERDLTIITFPPKSEVSYSIEINATIGNKSQQPASYAVINLFIDELFTIVHSGGLNRNSFTTSVRNHILNCFNINWSVNKHLPIFSGLMFRVADGPMLATLSSSSLQVTDFYLGYEIHTAGFSTRKFIHIVQHPKGTLQIIGEIDM